MSDDWLWSGGEPPDPDEAKQVAALGRLRRDRSLGPLPRRSQGGGWPIAAAAALALAGVALVWIDGGGAWTVRALAGERPCPKTRCYAEIGAEMAPGGDARWEVDLGGEGKLVLEGGARLTRLPGAGLPFRMSQGRAQVVATAAAGALRIETPAAKVVDLGCAYTLTVDPTSTALRVTKGTVALELPTGVAVVAGGHEALATLGRDPPIPMRLDAPPAFTAVVRAGGTAGTLDRARPEDLFTLWHVLQRVPEGERKRVLDKMVALEPGAAPKDEAAVLALEKGALTLLWQDIAPVAYAETLGR